MRQNQVNRVVRRPRSPRPRKGSLPETTMFPRETRTAERGCPGPRVAKAKQGDQLKGRTGDRRDTRRERRRVGQEMAGEGRTLSRKNLEGELLERLDRSYAGV